MVYSPSSKRFVIAFRAIVRVGVLRGRKVDDQTVTERLKVSHGAIGHCLRTGSRPPGCAPQPTITSLLSRCQSCVHRHVTSTRPCGVPTAMVTHRVESRKCHNKVAVLETFVHSLSIPRRRRPTIQFRARPKQRVRIS